MEPGRDGAYLLGPLVLADWASATCRDSLNHADTSILFLRGLNPVDTTHPRSSVLKGAMHQVFWFHGSRDYIYVYIGTSNT